MREPIKGAHLSVNITTVQLSS